MSFPKYYLRASIKKVRLMLAERRLPDGFAERIIDEVVEAKRLLHIENQKGGQHARLWKDLIAPAQAELHIIRRMRKPGVQSDSPERTAALEAYELVVSKVVGRIQVEASNTTEMPRYIAVEKKLPNKGEHWADWVPPKIQALVQTYFDVIPYVAGTKQKRPFKRRIPQTQHDIHKKRLVERTEKEIAHIERRIAAERADTRLTPTHVFKQQEIGAMRLQVSQMQAAMHRVSLFKPNDFVPVTWHGVKHEDNP